MGVGFTTHAGTNSFPASIPAITASMNPRSFTNILQWLANPNMPPEQAMCLEAFYEAHLLTEVTPLRAFGPMSSFTEQLYTSKSAAKCARWESCQASRSSPRSRPGFSMRAYRWLASSEVAFPAVRISNPHLTD